MASLQNFEEDRDVLMHDIYYEVLGDKPKNIPGKNYSSQTKYESGIEEYISFGIEDQDAGFPNFDKSDKSFSDFQQPCLKKYPTGLQQDQLQFCVDPKKVEDSYPTFIDQFPETDKSASSSRKTKKVSISSSSKFIFKEAPLKKQTKKFAISKFLVRMFLKYQSEFTKQQSSVEYNANLSKQFQDKRENKFNLQRDIAMIFGHHANEFDPSISQQNRATMAHILRHMMKEEIIMNSFTEKNRLSYLLGIRVFALRCRSKQLAKKASYR